MLAVICALVLETQQPACTQAVEIMRAARFVAQSNRDDPFGKSGRLGGLGRLGPLSLLFPEFRPADATDLAAEVAALDEDIAHPPPPPPPLYPTVDSPEGFLKLDGKVFARVCGLDSEDHDRPKCTPPLDIARAAVNIAKANKWGRPFWSGRAGAATVFFASDLPSGAVELPPSELDYLD